MIWHQDEPIGSTSIFAQWKVFQKAKENGITVMLDGQGSDEIFGGYLQFYGNLLLSYLTKGKIDHFFKEISVLKKEYHLSYFKTLKYMLSSLSTGMVFNYALSLSGKLSSKWAFSDPEIIQFPPWKKANLSVSKESLEQLFFSKLPILLHNEDRNSMAFSIESRVPFLDYRLVEFALSLDDSMKIIQGETKFILREGMKGILPEKIMKRKDKMAFVTAEELWVKENKEFFLNELNLLKSLTPNFIRLNTYDYFEKMINGIIPFDHSLIRFVSFGRWLRIFNVEI
jgi:asparagine synthase (glutamine-hydrolysing)